MGNFPLCASHEICICNRIDKKTNLENNELNDFVDTGNENISENYGNNINIIKDSKLNLINSTSKIQRAFRKYRENKLKQNKQSKQIKKKEYEQIKNSIIIGVSSSNNKVKKKKNNEIIIVNDTINKRRNSFQDASTIKRQHATILSFFTISSEEESNRTKTIKLLNTTNEEIYGYFLKKPNKSLKYHGEKDKNTHKKNGYGIVTWDDKSQLYGIFNDNKVYGFCKFINTQNKTIYKGEYIKNLPKGYGYYETLHYTRQGFFDKSKLNGIGLELWDDSTFYQGEYLENKKHGIGLYQWSDKTYYEGEWKNNQMTGYGMIYYSNGSLYSGEVYNGNMHGFGVFTWRNKHKYIGFFKNDLKNGFGVFIWQTKPLEAFVGFWEKGKQNGVGAKVNKGNFTYGIWVNGKKENWLKGEWEVKRCLTPEEVKYEKFLYKNELNTLIKNINV